MIARWTSVDPLAEDFDHMTPYNYGMNNPILMIDPDGMGADSAKVAPPKPAPKPIELQEVVVTAKRIYPLNHEVKPIIAEFPLYVGVRGAVTTIPRLVELVRDIDMLSSLVRLQNMISQHAVNTSDKTADELLPGSLKRSPSYNPKYGNLTREELTDLARKGDKVAKGMKKLIDQIPRLLDKNRNK